MVAEVTAMQVKELRDLTGAGMMDAKRALQESNGDFEEAAEFLKLKGLAKAAERASREATQGAIALATNGSSAAMAQLNAETDFSAKADDFLEVCQAIADAVLADGEAATESFSGQIDSLKISKKENISIGRVVKCEATDDQIIDTYLHKQDGRGVIGVIVKGSGVSPEDLHQVSLHVAFARPAYLSREQVDPDLVEKERAKALERTKEEGKPEVAWDKIVEGRLSGWFKEMVLMEQGLHGEKTSVAQSIGNGSIVAFEMFAIR